MARDDNRGGNRRNQREFRGLRSLPSGAERERERRKGGNAIDRRRRAAADRHERRRSAAQMRVVGRVERVEPQRDRVEIVLADLVP